MQALFVELPPFQRYRSDYLTDEEYRELQLQLLANPEAGDLIKGNRRSEESPLRRQEAQQGKAEWASDPLLPLGRWRSILDVYDLRQK